MTRRQVVRRPCPHCSRPIGVVGTAGRLARHLCVDSPGTMTPPERVRAARHTERHARRQVTAGAAALAGDQRELVWVLRARRVVPVLLLVGALTAPLTPSPVDLWVWLLVAATTWFGLTGRAGELAGRTSEGAARLSAALAAHDRAHAALLAVETDLPAVAWPELHPDPKEIR